MGPRWGAQKFFFGEGGSGGSGEVDLFGLARAVEAAERAGGVRGVVFSDEAIDEAGGEVVRESVALAVFGVGGVEEAHAFVEVAVEGADAWGLEGWAVGEGEQHELVDLGLELELESGCGEVRAGALGDVDEVAHAFDDLEPAIVGAAGELFERWEIGERGQDEGELELVGGLAEDEGFAVIGGAGAHELDDVGGVFELVEVLDAALDPTQGAGVVQCVIPLPRVGIMPREARASARGAEPVRSQRS